jgi:hypothetical protein
MDNKEMPETSMTDAELDRLYKNIHQGIEELYQQSKLDTDQHANSLLAEVRQLIDDVFERDKPDATEEQLRAWSGVDEGEDVADEPDLQQAAGSYDEQPAEWEAPQQQQQQGEVEYERPLVQQEDDVFTNAGPGRSRDNRLGRQKLINRCRVPDHYSAQSGKLINVNPGFTKAVLREIATWGTIFWASNQKIADDTQISLSSVANAIAVLKEARILTKESRRLGMTSISVLNWDVIESMGKEAPLLPPGSVEPGELPPAIAN